jgi:hypothetical protein
MGEPQRITFHASDVSGQKTAMVRDVPLEATVQDLLTGSLLSDMNLPKNDSEGRPLTYHPLNENAGRHLRLTESVRDAIKPNDRIIFQPDVDAGSRATGREGR